MAQQTQQSKLGSEARKHTCDLLMATKKARMPKVLEEALQATVLAQTSPRSCPSLFIITTSVIRTFRRYGIPLRARIATAAAGPAVAVGPSSGPFVLGRLERKKRNRPNRQMTEKGLVTASHVIASSRQHKPSQDSMAASSSSARTYDILVWGATGFTGTQSCLCDGFGRKFLILLCCRSPGLRVSRKLCACKCEMVLDFLLLHPTSMFRKPKRVARAIGGRSLARLEEVRNRLPSSFQVCGSNCRSDF
jgi:hypothetical protein